MAFRFFRRIRLAPGITLNLSRSGASVSLGPRGARLTLGGRTGARLTFGLPGTGLSYTTTLGTGTTGRRGRPSRRRASASREDSLTPSFWDTLTVPPEEQALLEACKALGRGDETAALEALRRAGSLPDAAYLEGFLLLKHERPAEAEEAFRRALRRPEQIGAWCARHGIKPVFSLPITEELSAHVEPSTHGLLLGLVEALQEQGKHEEALEVLARLQGERPTDPVVSLSLVELLWDVDRGKGAQIDRILSLTEEVGNETPVHACLLLYRARALRARGLPRLAARVLTRALARRKDRPPELLRALRYERALAFEEADLPARARADLEALYAEDPRYEDVARRLGLEP
ncbi:DUF4236 domain-containing protein [Spirochaeta thermophila]|uniref:3'-5' exonuclease n=1 Tax=Winmispira thermophila (strain ATCC 49972 / DSM 6192 / RI 19.B1) TaxID=665571 RepID=E0RT35_WINT6|nr:DUF4236 domain-containing protein [Spirochaeta thermophila]ADN02172.1 3'-5' exonuclease [Spirochaeta thermophila DSM 6192]